MGLGIVHSLRSQDKSFPKPAKTINSSIRIRNRQQGCKGGGGIDMDNVGFQVPGLSRSTNPTSCKPLEA
jgi:hypothetical protein